MADKKYSLKGRQVDVFNDTLDKANANEQVWMLIHGKWGTGKTRTMNAIIEGLKRIGIYSNVRAQPASLQRTMQAG